MTGEFHRMSGRRLQEWEFHRTEHWLEYGGAVVFVHHDQWDEVQFVSSGPVSLCEMLSASPALVLVHCYPRPSGFHFLNRFSKKRVETAPVAVVFSAFLFNSIHEAHPFRQLGSRRVRSRGAVSCSSLSFSSLGFLDVALEGVRIPLPLALLWVS